MISAELLFLLFAVRLLRLLRTLARAIRSAYVIRIFVVFLHTECENKTTFLQSQEFFKNFGYTKVTNSFRAQPSETKISDRHVQKIAAAPNVQPQERCLLCSS